MPEVIQFRNGSQILNRYDASGRKFESRFITCIITTTVPIGDVSDFHTSGVNKRYKEDITYYCDNYEYSFDRVSRNPFLSKIHNVEGYKDGRDIKNDVLHYYRRDHLGNVREVCKSAASGVVSSPFLTVQRMQYYPSGLPWADCMGADYQNRKYNGKEFIEMHGYDSYDYHARHMFPALMRFTTPDPLAEKYYSISPYAYCANNPVRFIDPDGREIDLSHMSEEERKRFESQLTLQREKSKLFNTMYTSLENSKDVYVVKFGQTISGNIGSEPVKGQFSANKEGGGIVTFLETEENIHSSVMSEEFFHAFQHDNRNNYEIGEFNFEFEAKVFTTAVGIEFGGFMHYPGMHDFQDKINTGNYEKGLQIVSPDIVDSKSFLNDYTNSANRYAKYNRNNNYGNMHYKKNTTVAL